MRRIIRQKGGRCVFVEYALGIGGVLTPIYRLLFDLAIKEALCRGRNEGSVYFIMDEFANCCLPDSFDSLLSTMRSREISVSIIIQNMAQLKALFEKKWESITGNCDEFLYLGGNEQSTHEYVSKLLGKETIDTNTYGQNKGRQGSFTKNDQTQGRELLTPDEVGKLDNRYAILKIRGEDPVMDLKYDLMKHPNVKYTSDGGAPIYVHGEDRRSSGVISLVGDEEDRAKAVDVETLFKEDELYVFEVRSYQEIED